jgi:hypothetical protein
MTDRAFVVASEAMLIDLIRRAQRRLVVICPALSNSVASAVAERLADEGTLHATVILDSDPEVYRLGYGTVAALERISAAAKLNLFDLRVQHGVRIGVVISDELTMVFSPVPQFIEAGSTSIEKPNAVVLSAGTADSLAEAAGAGAADTAERQEIGTQALTPDKVQAVKDDLKANPPQSFDITRALRVFSSKVQYVDLKIENYRFSSRKLKLPPELLNTARATLDGALRRLSCRLSAHA